MDKPGKPPRYGTGAHTTHRLRFDLVLVPQYRKRVRAGPRAAPLEERLYQACEVNGWELHELWILPDPVPLLVQVLPKDSAASVVQRLKGGTSRQMRSELPALTQFLWGASLWAAGYLAQSIGKVAEATIRKYIGQQPMPPDEPQAG